MSSKKAKIIGYLVGIGSLAVLAGVVAYIVMTVSPALIVKGTDMAEEDVRYLEDLGILANGEKLIYFYSNGLYNIRDSGCFFTDRKVATYRVGINGREIQQAKYGQIQSIEPQYSDSMRRDSRIVVSTEDGGEIVLEVTNEQQGDKTFFARLEKEWDERR